jgi:hypothetical protein
MLEIPLYIDQLTPLPVDSGYYVAALQNKRGELAALENASEESWERLVPLVHFVGSPTRTEALRGPTVAEWVKKVSKAVGSHPFYLDVMRLAPTFPVVTTQGEVPVLEHLFRTARKRGLGFIPVVSVGESSADHARLVADAVLEDGHGVALRYRIRTVPPTGNDTRATLFEAALLETSCDVGDADVLIDLEYIDPDVALEPDDLAPALNEILGVGSWRSVVVLGSSIPSMMSCVAEGTVGSLARREWELWSGLAESSGLARVPAFGDYAVQHPRPPQDVAGGGNTMRANIRYTAGSETLVARGRGPVSQDTEQYRDLCQQLVERGEFMGRDYSWGDAVIDGCAAGDVPVGNQNTWRGAGTSHHLKFVTDQLRRRQPAERNGG